MGFPAVFAFNALYGEHENTFGRFDGTVVVTMADETGGEGSIFVFIVTECNDNTKKDNHINNLTKIQPTD